MDFMIPGHKNWINSILMLDAKTVLTASDDLSLCAWDLETGMEIGRLDFGAGRRLPALPGKDRGQSISRRHLKLADLRISIVAGRQIQSGQRIVERIGNHVAGRASDGSKVLSLARPANNDNLLGRRRLFPERLMRWIFLSTPSRSPPVLALASRPLSLVSFLRRARVRRSSICVRHDTMPSREFLAASFSEGLIVKLRFLTTTPISLRCASVCCERLAMRKNILWILGGFLLGVGATIWFTHEWVVRAQQTERPRQLAR